MVKKVLLSISLGAILGIQILVAQRVVVIGLDGFSVEGYERTELPHLKQLMSEGVLSLHTRCVMPSVTLPNWTSHLTGSGPEEHGVVNNQWTLTDHSLPALETDDQGYYPSIFKLLKDQVTGVKTAYYYNWANLIHPINQKYLDEVSYLEDDAYLENYDKAVRFIEENASTPTFIFLYSVHTDHAGHSFEWMSPEFITALEEADEAIGKLLDQLKQKGFYEDTHFFLITDHGGLAKSHGGVSENEMLVPWGVTGPGIQSQFGGKRLDFPNSNINTAWVIARIFNCHQIPVSWTGRVPEGIFEAPK